MTEEATETKVVETQRFCKGTMPSPLVWFIKFHESIENKSAVAKKYFTTPGKIADIQSNSNQKYIVEDMVWTDEELDSAVEGIKANFVRGQDEEGNPVNLDNKRGTATTQAGDEDASIEAIDAIRGMEPGDEAVTLGEARAAYNEANPRAPRKAKSEDAEPVGDAEVDELDEEALLDE